jgi:hypothetical protein
MTAAATAAAAARWRTGMAARAAAPPAAGGFLEFRRRFARRIRFAVGDDGFALRSLLADFGTTILEPDLQMKNFIIKLLCGQKNHGKFVSDMIWNCARFSLDIKL